MQPFDHIARGSSPEVGKIEDARRQFGARNTEDRTHAKRLQEHVQAMEVAVVAQDGGRILQAAQQSWECGRALLRVRHLDHVDQRVQSRAQAYYQMHVTRRKASMRPRRAAAGTKS